MVLALALMLHILGNTSIRVREQINYFIPKVQHTSTLSLQMRTLGWLNISHCIPCFSPM